jgi:hypothetical protein
MSNGIVGYIAPAQQDTIDLSSRLLQITNDQH